MLAIITVAFFMMRAAPGSPYSTERKLTPAVEANLRAHMGLDKPLHEQYFEYLGKVVQGDLGPSMQISDKSVSELLGEGLPVSLTIGGLAITLGLFVPLLPSFVFWLLAAWAWAKARPGLTARLLAHPRLGPALYAYLCHGAKIGRAHV